MKEIKLTQGQTALVDDEDYDYLMQWKWHAKKDAYTYYAGSNIRLGVRHHKSISMHRIIMNPPHGYLVDHIDHNGLNNQKSNLRICTKRQNRLNSLKRKECATPYKGVMGKRRRTPKNPWRYRACIRVNGELIGLGNYNTPEEAARAYDMAAIKYYGEFALLNFPRENYELAERYVKMTIG